MKRLHFLALMAVLFLFLGSLLSCGEDDDDDNATEDDADDDDASGDDDDDDSGDDDDDVVSGETWTDSFSGLTWQVYPFLEPMDWDDALSFCNDLDLEGGDWQLPTISQLRTMVRGCDTTEADGECGVTDTCLSRNDCWDQDLCFLCSDHEGFNNGCYGPFELPGECNRFWSSSADTDGEEFAWAINFGDADLGTIDKAAELTARCVHE